MKLIDKDALLAEIERLKNTSLEYGYNTMQKVLADSGKDLSLGQLQYFLDTLEVKEVDLDIQTFAKEMDTVFALPSSETKNTEEEPLNWEYAIAKHFFELGLNASNPLTWKDIKEICVQSVLVEIDLGGLISDERHYTEVLKRFKTQKGERV